MTSTSDPARKECDPAAPKRQGPLREGEYAEPKHTAVDPLPVVGPGADAVK